MSMVNKKWSDLAYEAKVLGADISCAVTKQDLINLIAQAKSTGPVLMQLPCQLAKDFTSLSAAKQEAILKGGEYIGEEKFDGCRAKIHFLDDRNRIDTRNQCTETYCYTEKTNNFPHLLQPVKQLIGTVVDGEMIMPCTRISEGKTQTVDQLSSTAAVFNSQPGRAVRLQSEFGLMDFYIFDVLFYKGKDVRCEPFVDRRNMVNAVIRQIRDAEEIRSMIKKCFKLSLAYDGKEFDLQEYYNRMVRKGAEGIMLKNKQSMYSSKEGTRRQRVWYKWKATQSIDCFITGYIPGQGKYDNMVGALCVSVFDKNDNTREIASVAPGSDATRQQLTKEGELADFAYMQVVEVSYQSRTKNGRLRHPVLVKFRPELHYLTCVDHYFD